MLIRERFEECHFSTNEQSIVDYILKEKLNIKGMTTKEIAKNTYTSPSTLIRISHKMGFNGWDELKNAYLKEETYLNSHFVEIDANYPFDSHDNIMSISSKVALLKEEAIKDTQTLLTHDLLQSALRIIKKKQFIQVFAVSNNIHNAKMFQHNLRRINYRCELIETQGDTVYSAMTMDALGCAIIISYSGETPVLVRSAKLLKEHHIPIIALTNIGNSTLSKLADVVLPICTREKLYSKIATYTTDASITYILDVLYSCVYALNYDGNKQLKEKNSKAIETGRFSTTDILKED